MKQPSENRLGSMWLDAHETMQDPNKASFALNAIRRTYSAKDFGYANERGTEICAKLPSGYKLRGYTQLAERNEFIVFLSNGSNSEIGGVNYDTCTYKKYLNDSEINCKLEFGLEEWIYIEAKRIQPCNEVELYWSNGRVYKYFNIDNVNKHLIKSCNDVRIFKDHSPPTAKIRTVKSGGYSVLNGTYQVAIQLTDENNNHTNWYRISQSAKIYGGDNKAGEKSNQYLEIVLEGLSTYFSFVNVAIIKTIGGKVSSHIIHNRYPYTQSKKILEYRGITDEKEDIPLSTIFLKKDYWINGKGLIQKDNRLILYDIDNHYNLDYQRTANKARVGFAAYRVRIEDAHLHPTLLGGESYPFGISWNYIDGTKSAVFPYINQNVAGLGSAPGCSGCNLAAWEATDTSTIEWQEASYKDPIEESAQTQKQYKGYNPKEEPYKTVDEWGQEHKDKAKEDMDKVLKELDDAYEDLEDTLEATADSGCCDATVVLDSKSKKFICEGKLCPPGCHCIDGCCYRIIYETVLEPRGTGPETTPEQSEGCGGIYEDVPNDITYEICNPLPADYFKQDKRISLGYTSCSSTGKYCPGCVNCVGESESLGLRESPNVNTITCSGRAVGTGCGSQVEVIVDESLSPRDSPTDSIIPDEPIYAEDGCTILGYKPKKFLTGQFGYAESLDTYPETKDCNEEYVYGEYAGQRIRLFKTPSREKIPHFMSYTDGVRSILEPGNDELARGYVTVIGVDIVGIEFPKKTPKPLDQNRPYTIYTMKRDNANKTILAKGLTLGTFEGEIYGDKLLFPRPGTNGIELFNRYIQAKGRTSRTDSSSLEDHAGQLSETHGYTFHSPTTTFSKPSINGEYFDIELEIYGKGFRHGSYAMGNEPSDSAMEKISGLKQILSKSGTNVPRMNQKGTRSTVFLNKMDKNTYNNCIVDLSYVKADSLLKKTKKMTLSYCNRDSESCVFIELKDKLQLKHNIDKYLADGRYNGTGLTQADQTGDGSCFGDVKYPTSPIYLASGHYGSIKRRNVRQYGRLEKATWITTGIEGTESNINGVCGDNYISFYSFTKSVYLSDRVGKETLVKDPLTFSEAAQAIENAPEESDDNKRGDKAKKGASGLKRVMLNMTGSNLAWTLGLCGNIPIAGLSINIDPRNKAGLRYFNPWTKNDKSNGEQDVKYGGFWDGETPFNGHIPYDPPSSGDTGYYRAYYPGLYKQEIIFPVESEIATELRETGEEIDKEINYFENKSYGLDSSFSNNQGWKNHYLNKFYIKLPEVSLYQKLLMTLIIFAVRVIFPAYIAMTLGKYIQGGGGIAGTLISLVIQIVIVLLVILLVLLLFIALKTFASEYLLQFLGLRQCFNDSQGGPGDGFKEDFHDNYAKYNYDYSKLNTIEWNYGMTHNYNTCECLAEPSNKVLSSNPQIIDSPANSWLQFKINNFLEVEHKYGKITNMFIIGADLYAHTTEMIYKMGITNANLNADENSDLSQDYIVAAQPLTDGVIEGFAGLRNPNCSINTPSGYIWIDDEACRIYSFNGQVTEISNQGLRQFMKENLRLKTLEENPNFFPVDQKTDNGIGYALGYDYKNERLMLTKKDKQSWTLSYSPEENAWISFHSYVPHLYMYDRYNMFTEHEGAIWKFNSGPSYHTYFGVKYPHIIEFIGLVDGYHSVNHKYLELKTEANVYSKAPYLVTKDINHTFNKGLFYNTKQSTGYLNLILTENGTSLLGNMKESSKSVRISTQDGVWRISDLKDYTIDSKQPIVYNDHMYLAHPISSNMSSSVKHMFLQDKYIVYQFILDDRHDMELLSFGGMSHFDYRTQ